jgi:hypothetical protein
VIKKWLEVFKLGEPCEYEPGYFRTLATIVIFSTSSCVNWAFFWYEWARFKREWNERFKGPPVPKKVQFTQERVEYNVFLFEDPLKGSKSLKIFKINLTFCFDKLSHLSKSVHIGENFQILSVERKKKKKHWFGVEHRKRGKSQENLQRSSMFSVNSLKLFYGGYTETPNWKIILFQIWSFRTRVKTQKNSWETQWFIVPRKFCTNHLRAKKWQMLFVCRVARM